MRSLRSPRRPLASLRLGLVLLGLALVASLPAAALTINVTLSNSTLSPPFDPGAVKLQQHMEAAAAHWESIIQDPGTIDIEYFYWEITGFRTAWTCIVGNNGQCLPDGATVADLSAPMYIAVDVSKPVAGNPLREYYFDPTPTDHSEFAMQQVLARDYQPVTMNLFFDGDVPDRLETGYFGAALPSAPAAAQDDADMLTILLHELGHALGMIKQRASAEAAGDLDYDIDPDFVNVQVMAAETLDTSVEHLKAADSLMAEQLPLGERRLPSALDVFAIAAAAGWQDIQLPRREFWGTPFFNLALAWAGGKHPISTTDAFVRSGGATAMFADVGVQELLVSDDTQLSTGASELQVSGFGRVEAGAGTGVSELVVESDALIGGLEVGDGGVVTVDGATLATLLTEIEDGGVLAGAGQLDAWIVINDGVLAGADGVFLNVDTLDLSADLDGDSEGGVLEALAGSLRFFDEPADAFDGTMMIGPGQSIDFQMPWSLGAGGTLHLAGAAAPPHAELEGAEVDVQGTVAVAGVTRSDAPIRLGASGTIDLAADARFETEAMLELAGGTVSGDGILRVDGGATVTADTVLNARVVDLDGSSGSSTTTVSRVLDLQIESFEEFNDTFDGTLVVDGQLARLGVQLDDPTEQWTMAGLLQLHSWDAAAAVQLSGNDVLVTGTLEVDGNTRITAAMDLMGTLWTVDAQAVAHLAGGGVHTIRWPATASSQVVVDAGTTLRLEDAFEGWTRLTTRGRLELLGFGADPVADPRVSTFTQAAGSVLAIDLGGTTAGVDHDRLRTVSGATLAGGLEVQLVGGFVPSLGDRFELVSTIFGAVTGSWDPAASSLPSLGRGLAWQVDVDGKIAALEVVAQP